jgi:hypothetical protein
VAPPAAEPRQDVEGERQDLQRQEHEDQVVGRGDQDHPSGRERDQRVELAAVPLGIAARLVGVVDAPERRHDHQDHGGEHHEPVHRHRVAQHERGAGPVPELHRDDAGRGKADQHDREVHFAPAPARERFVEHADDPGAPQEQLGHDRLHHEFRRRDRRARIGRLGEQRQDVHDHGLVPSAACSVPAGATVV